MRRVEFEELEPLMKKLGISRDGLCRICGIKKSAYYEWRVNGISGAANNMLLVLMERPDVVMSVLLRE